MVESQQAPAKSANIAWWLIAGSILVCSGVIGLSAWTGRMQGHGAATAAGSRVCEQPEPVEQARCATDGMISSGDIRRGMEILRLGGQNPSAGEVRSIAVAAVTYGRAYDVGYGDALIQICTAIVENDRAFLSRLGI